MTRRIERTVDPCETTRRRFLSHVGLGIGSMALTGLLPAEGAAGRAGDGSGGGFLHQPHFTPRAK
ncbi:MAG: twin-arginine translocation signal domain-containing protein, partial [Pirellulales bacterium]